MSDGYGAGIDIEGVFDFESAIERLDFFERMDDRPSLGVFVVDAIIQDGLMSDLILRIKKSKWFKNVPVVVYTGTSDEIAKNACLSAGAIRVIQKGANRLAELSNFIASLLPKPS